MSFAGVKGGFTLTVSKLARYRRHISKGLNMAKRARELVLRRVISVTGLPMVRSERGSKPYLTLVAEEGREAFLTLPRAIAIILIVVITTLMLLYLWQSWQLIYLSGELLRSKEALELLESRNELLRLEVSKAFSLERIQRLAKGRLGMEEPAIKYLILPSE